MTALDSETDVELARSEISAWLDRTLPADRDNGFDLPGWQRAAFSAGFVMAGWPRRFGGRSYTPRQVAAVNAELVRRAPPVPYYAITHLMIGSVLQQLATEEQQSRFLPSMASAEQLWCQLFSEPGAGSDLASLATRAVVDGDHWIVTGQKVWSSFAKSSGRGLLLTRTDPDVPKHQGITAFALDMTLPGVDVRPLRQITADETFCEVFLDGVVVPDADRIGEVDNGWAVVSAVLAAERTLQSGVSVSPVGRVGGMAISDLVLLAEESDATQRDRAVDLWLRDRALNLLAASRGAHAHLAPVLKLAHGETNQAMQELALDLAGVDAIAYESGDRSEKLIYGFLRSRANTIGGGTSEILRTVIGERLLGLPKEPDPYRGVPWRELPRS